MILAILQVRMSSSRLPGKVLKPILGEPMFYRQVERILQVASIDKLVVATSVSPSDDAIEAVCKTKDLNLFRGSLEDVLDRFYQVAVIDKPKYILRFTGDCPLIDPGVIESVINIHIEGHFDYTSNAVEPTFPDGLDTEVFNFQSLVAAWENAKTKMEREHVTPYLYNPSHGFKVGHYKNSVDLSHLRWTVDQEEDLLVIQAIYEALYDKKEAFCMAEILDYLEAHPEIGQMNRRFKRNEGLQRNNI